jgi:hypothetical protein
MGFLKRLLGGGQADQVDADPMAPARDDAAERAYELELARSEQDRLDDLAQRQLRYAAHAWEPPPQGGPRRADDTDPPAD